MRVPKFLQPAPKKLDFGPKNDQIWPKTGIFGQFGPGHAGLFGALLAGRLVVVARGLYLARHLFTLLSCLIPLRKHLQRYIVGRRLCTKLWRSMESLLSERGFLFNCGELDFELVSWENCRKSRSTLPMATMLLPSSHTESQWGPVGMSLDVHK